MPKVQCGYCGTAFTPDACRTRYCDGECYHAAQRRQSADSVVTRFWGKVDKSGDCWLWTGGLIRGYGQFNIGRFDGKQKTVYAHRYAWTIMNGPIPDDLQVCHRCDVPLCCNPNHLFLGTVQDNLDDARRKGRLVDGAHLIKLSDRDMADIRVAYKSRSGVGELARRYGVSPTTIYRVAHGTQRVRKPVSPSHVQHRVMSQTSVCSPL